MHLSKTESEKNKKMKINFLILTALALIFAVAESLPRNCEDIQYHAVRHFKTVKSGIYKIYPSNAKADGMEVFCDMETAGGGWIVIQRRVNGLTDFYNDWDTYVKGFGSLELNLWLGLQLISGLTNADNYILRIDLVGKNGDERFAEYHSFRVANSSELYKLTVNDYRGSAGNALGMHNGARFTTKDRDNDDAPYNCAQQWHGAWCYKFCYRTNLNGLYDASNLDEGINWRPWPSDALFPNMESLARVEMKVRTLCYSKLVNRNSQ